MLRRQFVVEVQVDHPCRQSDWRKRRCMDPSDGLADENARGWGGDNAAQFRDYKIALPTKWL
jgi:hypothetical protein